MGAGLRTGRSLTCLLICCACCGAWRTPPPAGMDVTGSGTIAFQELCISMRAVAPKAPRGKQFRTGFKGLSTPSGGTTSASRCAPTHLQRAACDACACGSGALLRVHGHVCRGSDYGGAGRDAGRSGGAGGGYDSGRGGDDVGRDQGGRSPARQRAPPYSKRWQLKDFEYRCAPLRLAPAPSARKAGSHTIAKHVVVGRVLPTCCVCQGRVLPH